MQDKSEGHAIAESHSSAERKARIFVSYSRQDNAFARRLVDALLARHFDAFLDTKDIVAGEDWQARLGKLILAADTVVFVVSPDSIGSKFCAWEVQEATLLDKRIVPVVARDTPNASVVPSLARLHFLSFKDDTAFETQVGALTTAIETDLDWIREHTRLAEIAQRWNSAGRRTADLLRGKALEETEAWALRHPRTAPPPSEQQRAFIAASRQSATRRGRGLVAAALAVAIVASALAWSANESRKEAERQTQIAQYNETRANQNFTLAKQAADGLILDIARGLRNVAGISQNVIQTVLKRAETVMDTLVAGSYRNPQLMLSQSLLLKEFAETFWSAGDTRNVLKSADRSLMIIDDLLTASPNDAALQNIRSDNLHILGDTLRLVGEMDRALAYFRIAQGVHERIVNLAPASVEDWRRLAYTRDRVGDVMRTDSRFQEAATEYTAAEAIRLNFLKADPDDERWLYDLSWTHNRIGDNLRGISDHHAFIVAAIKRRGDATAIATDRENAAAALVRYRQGLEIRRSLAQKSPFDTKRQRDTAWSLNLVGMAMLATGDLQGAMKSHHDSFEMLSKLLATDQKNAEWQRDLSLTHNFIADVMLIQGDPQPAFDEYDKGLRIREKLAEIDPNNTRWLRDLFHTRRRLFEVCRAFGDPEIAEQHRKIAMQLAQRARAAFPADQELARAISELEDIDH
jgi:tetratricopeptide (TPR) repeat protein